MAISKDIWDKAKVMYELGHTLGDISNTLEIDKGGLSRKAKKENWVQGKNQQLKSDIIEYEHQKSTLEEKKSTLIEKLSTLENYEITIFDKIIENELNHKSLVFSTQTLALVRNNQILTKNTKTVMLKTGEYIEGKKVDDRYEPYEVELSPTDIKEIIDSTDKASITLKVNERFAPKVEVNNNNNQQNIEPPTIIFQRIENKSDS